MNQLIRYVGDPFVDTGIATLEQRIEKACDEMTIDDLRRQATDLEEIYAKKAWVGYLTVHFPNSAWCNPTMSATSKTEQRNRLLRSFDAPSIPGKACAYCRRPAQHLADRSIIPLTAGAANMSCPPNGEPGFPICSGCQFAIQFYPLAAMKVEGRPLFWWSLDEQWMRQLTSDFVRQVQQLTATPDQVPSLKWPATRLLESLQTALENGETIPRADLIGCHVTNYGSGPDFREFRIPKGLAEFMRAGKAWPAYDAIKKRGWEAVKKAKKQATPTAAVESSRNSFYEDLGAYLWNKDLTGYQLVRRHFHPLAGRPGVFDLACIFARKVLSMTPEQVAAIKQVAHAISKSKQAKQHLDRLFERRGLTSYIRSLVDMSDRMKRAGENALSLETVLTAFDLKNEDDVSYRNASLVRELILLALIEELPSEEIPETTEAED